MAVITRDEPESRATQGTPGETTQPMASPRFALAAIPPLYLWVAGVASIIVVLVVCLAVWGPEMEFPTTVAHVQSSDGSTSFPGRCETSPATPLTTPRVG